MALSSNFVLHLTSLMSLVAITVYMGYRAISWIGNIYACVHVFLCVHTHTHVTRKGNNNQRRIHLGENH